jgi:carboxyl-terminal processing protease
MTSIRLLVGRLLPTMTLTIVIFTVGFIVGTQSNITFAQDNTQPPPEAREAFGAFWQTFNLIQDDYLEDVPVETLVDGALTGMMDVLGDEFSSYMNPELFPLLNQDLEGSITGIGVVIRTNEAEEIEVVGLLEDSPAEKAGVLPGDIFAEVDGQNMLGVSQSELAAVVRGEEGTTVEITFRRGEELIELSIVRARIEIPNIETDKLEGGIGYVALNQFSPNAREELEGAIDDLNLAELNGLVIDFRGNPGGLLDSAIDVGSLLVDEGTIVYEDFGNREIELSARGDAIDIDIPIVLLVDETSASASELVAGAWQDYDVVTVMGETTFGKGTVQTWHTLINGGGVRLTIARWLTPERNWIHEQGITPDIIVEWNPSTPEEAETDLQLQAAIDFLLGETATAPVQ